VKGIPGFIGGRLTEARVARGLTATALAEITGLTPGAISHYETGKNSPRLESLQLIAERLQVPVRYFHTTLVGDIETPIHFRAYAYAAKGMRERVAQRYRWLRIVVDYLHTYLEFPPLNLPSLAGGDPTDAGLEAAAAEVRRVWNLDEGPIHDLVLVLENNGIVVSRTNFDSLAMDAFSQWAPSGLPFVVLGTDKSSAARSRYDAAHELAHILFHRAVTSAEVGSKKTHKALELQAFRFARALLLPASSFTRDLWAPTLESFRMLKERWRVSIGVMLARAVDLDLVSEAEAKRMWIAYARRGWRRVEPLDDELPLEQPRLIRRSFDVLFSSGLKTRSQVLAEIPLSQGDIESVCGLPSGYLNDDFGAVVQFQVRQRLQPRASDT
jgi:Zn-dependent peptidase ImmA (M78 family)/DNA-binding XRE family transcriptional regulator